MALRLQTLHRLCRSSLNRAYSTTPSSSSGHGASTVKPPSPPPKPKGVNADVPGLSARCVEKAQGPVGPGASTTGEYKVPEYFLYSRISYAEAEIEMAKYRCPQPSAVKH